MTQWLETSFKNIFGNNIILAVFCIAILPLIELRGAIPFGMSTKIWGNLALTNWQAFLCAYMGSMIIVPIIALLFTPILNFFKKTKWFNNLATNIENKIKRKSNNILNNAKNRTITHKEVTPPKNKLLLYKMLGVILFVAIPLPFTGAWTGTCISIMLGISVLNTILAIAIGNCMAGLLMTLLSTAFNNYTHIIFLVFLIISIIIVLSYILKTIFLKIKHK